MTAEPAVTPPALPDSAADPGAYVLAVAELREQRAQAACQSPTGVYGKYIVEEVGRCTCGAGGEFPHEQHCGLEPALDLTGAFGEFLEPEASPMHALAEVVLWRGIVERHEVLPLHGPQCRWCDNQSWPCPDLRAVVASCQAYMGGAS